MQKEGAGKLKNGSDKPFFPADLDEVFFFPSLVQSKRQRRRSGGG
jgi:hypothetical protein